jgi:hypothetical protein
MVIIHARYSACTRGRSADMQRNVLEMPGLAIPCHSSMVVELEDKSQLIPHFITCDATSNLKNSQVRLQ